MRRLLLAFFRKLASLVGVPEIQGRLDALDAGLTDMRSQQMSRQAAFERLVEKRTTEQILDRIRDTSLLLSSLGPHLDEIQQALTQSMIEHTEVVANQLRELIQRKSSEMGDDVRSFTSQMSEQIQDLTGQLARHRRYIDNIQIPRPVISSAPASTAANIGTAAPISDAMYVALEDHFRGDASTIRERQRQHLPLIRQAPVNQGYVLDLGCGRGEWLTLLVSEGIRAEGLDSNTACVNECLRAGLTVHHGDVIAHLRALPDESCSAITMFQVLEHLPFPLIIDVLRESRRVLQSGGLLIGEVPNAENLTVAASTFWIDPTHQKPLFPGLLKFLAQESGFARTDGVYSTPLRTYPDTVGNNEALDAVLRDIYSSLYGNADFTLIAWA